jgi:hypothetical protein
VSIFFLFSRLGVVSLLCESSWASRLSAATVYCVAPCWFGGKFLNFYYYPDLLLIYNVKPMKKYLIIKIKICQLHSEGKFTTPRRDNRKIRFVNVILKANEHASPYVYKLQSYRMTQKNLTNISWDCPLSKSKFENSREVLEIFANIFSHTKKFCEISKNPRICAWFFEMFMNKKTFSSQP